MKTSNRKKIIIGYRYDPSTHSIDRLHELQATDDCIQFSDHQHHPLTGKNYPQSDLIRSLKNQSMFIVTQDLLLKTQIKRIQQKTSFRSYQLLASQHQNLQKQCHQLKIQVQRLKESLFQMENKYKTLKIEKSTKHSSQEIHQIERNDSWKYTFSPYHNLNSQENLQKSQLSKEDLSEKSSRFPSQKHFIALKTPPQMNESLVNKLVSQRFLQNEGGKSSSFGQINNEQLANFNNLQALQRQIFKGFCPQEYFKGIDSEYLYSDLRTIESEKSQQRQKSQQLESMVQLDANFSFMPRPLKKNQPSMKVLTNTTKKVSFNDEVNLLYSSKEFSFSHNSMGESPNISQPSLSASVNEQQQSNKDVLSGLSGLRKLPQKPTRIQSKGFDSILDK